MPWHLSKSNPRKLYDERHNVVAICDTPEQASLVVKAVNRFHDSAPAGKESARPVSEHAGLPVEAGRAVTPITDVFDADECCGKYLARALRSGIRGETWTCPKCGCDWKADLSIPPVRRWSPDVAIEILRMGR